MQAILYLLAAAAACAVLGWYMLVVPGESFRGGVARNIEVVITGAKRDAIVIGAHYDSVDGSPGANDNGSGVAAALELALAFREQARFPSEGVAAPAIIPGVDWSDQWSFWRHGVPALMLTDTAPYRYPHYHQASDTPDKVDYERLARVVTELERMFRALDERLYDAK